MRVADQHRQGAPVIVARGLLVKRSQAVAKHALGLGVGAVADFNVKVLHCSGFLGVGHLSIRAILRAAE
ncbi:hypothetical protein AO262_23025 [Pseudomonas fluorescens ABAC62]|nr:hypothetical protein AO262_23025 [Pseudomonas fluorescens ABAC62]